MNLFAALRYLDQHTNLEATAGRAEGLSLERMQRLVGVLGDPQAAYPVIHITGTNGKGSVARMLTELLQQQGLTVGTYTSPHLEQINERIAWNGEPIDDVSLATAIGASGRGRVVGRRHPLVLRDPHRRRVPMVRRRGGRRGGDRGGHARPLRRHQRR